VLPDQSAHSFAAAAQRLSALGVDAECVRVDVINSDALATIIQTVNAAHVLVASIMGVKGAANQVAYSASRGGVIAMTRSMRIDLAPAQIRVNCVTPPRSHFSHHKNRLS
jgi:NAD(P)-dependent dehydrogenase (short-subunit alcohol dehydrogenase family)